MKLLGRMGVFSGLMLFSAGIWGHAFWEVVVGAFIVSFFVEVRA